MGADDAVTASYIPASPAFPPYYPTYPTYPTYPSYPTWPTYPTYPAPTPSWSWPTYPAPTPSWSWPNYPAPTPSWSWPAPTPSWSWPAPTPSWSYPGAGASCSAHSQCGSGQYCYSCARCLFQPGCVTSITCARNPTGGECAPLANCARDNDPIDGRCPSSGGGGSGVCSGVSCPYGQTCVPDPKACFTTPCPQYRCEDNSASACAAVTCPRGQQCVPTNIVCIRAPCPQYNCVPVVGGGDGGNTCGRNEEYTSCGSSSCWEDSCLNNRPWPPQVCTADCRSGCRCKQGYKRSFDGGCYTVCAISGRPFSSEKGFLVAPVMQTPHVEISTNAPSSLNVSSDPLFTSVLSEEELNKVANYWAKIAMMEHASVASFSRFSLELMSIGASPELLALAHQAALDEVRHTQVSLKLANQFAAKNFTAGSFPISNKDADFAFGDIEKIATAAALEGCIEETLAAAVVLYQADHMADTEHKALLRVVAMDEASHAAFAWRAVQWMASTSPKVHTAVSAVFSARAERYEAEPEAASISSLEHVGLLNSETTFKIQHTAWHQVVVPAASALGFLPAASAEQANATPIADIIARSLSCNQAPIA